MKRLMAFMALSIFCAGCLLPAGCGFTSSFDEEKRVTSVAFHVGVKELTVVHGEVQMPTDDVSIQVGSDLAVLIVDGVVGGGFLRSIVEGIQATHNWVWGIE